MFVVGNHYRRNSLTINCIFWNILYNFQRWNLPNTSSQQTPLGFGFCSNLPALENFQHFRKVGEFVEKLSDMWKMFSCHRKFSTHERKTLVSKQYFLHMHTLLSFVVIEYLNGLTECQLKRTENVVAMRNNCWVESYWMFLLF